MQTIVNCVYGQCPLYVQLLVGELERRLRDETALLSKTALFLCSEACTFVSFGSKLYSCRMGQVCLEKLMP